MPMSKKGCQGRAKCKMMDCNKIATSTIYLGMTNKKD